MYWISIYIDIVMFTKNLYCSVVGLTYYVVLKKRISCLYYNLSPTICKHHTVFDKDYMFFLYQVIKYAGGVDNGHIYQIDIMNTCQSIFEEWKLLSEMQTYYLKFVS